MSATRYQNSELARNTLRLRVADSLHWKRRLLSNVRLTVQTCHKLLRQPIDDISHSLKKREASPAYKNGLRTAEVRPKHFHKDLARKTRSFLLGNAYLSSPAVQQRGPESRR